MIKYILAFVLTSLFTLTAHSEEPKKPTATATASAKKLSPADLAALDLALTKISLVQARLENLVMQGNAEIAEFNKTIDRICKENKINRDKISDIVDMKTGDFKSSSSSELAKPKPETLEDKSTKPVKKK